LCKEISSAFKKDGNEDEDEMKKSEVIKNVDEYLVVNLAVENIILDVFPYYSSSYFVAQAEKDVNLDPKKSGEVYHCGMRALVAIDRVDVFLTKRNKKINFDGIEVTAIDLLFKNTKYPLAEPHNSRILRSEDRDRNLFERDFDELVNRFGFAARPIRLSEFKVKRNENGEFEISLEKF
jgi:hypothetical protein